MKKTILSLLFITLCVCSFSQVTFLNEDASKVYPEGNKITYFTVVGLEAYVESFDEIQKTIVENPKIYRFKIMDKAGSFCMYDADASIKVADVIKLINVIVSKIDNDNEFPSSH